MELCIRELATAAAAKEKDNNKLQQAAQPLEIDAQQIAQKGERNYIIEDVELLKPNKCLKIGQIYVPIKSWVHVCVFVRVCVPACFCTCVYSKFVA